MKTKLSIVNKKILLTLLFAISITFNISAAYKPLSISSPNGNLKVKISLNEKLSYSVDYRGENMVAWSPVSMQLADGKVLGLNPTIIKKQTTKVDRVLPNNFGKRKFIKDNFTELSISLKGNYGIIFRVYNEGFSYRFFTSFSQPITVLAEQASFNFPEDNQLYYIAKPKRFYENTGEGRYVHESINQIPDSVFALTPLVVSAKNGVKIALAESSLFDYPGLNVKRNEGLPNSLSGYFAPEVESEIPNGWTYTITKRRNYLAQTKGTREFPWRMMFFADKDIDLTDCDMVYKLAKPAQNYGDLSWVKPGKAAWDWWADWSIQGVDFKGEAGSFEYYKYLIDFAASHHLEHVEISVGWMNDQNILEVNPKIRMPELVQYAKSKNVGVMVWVVAQTLERQFDDAFNLFSQLGVSGVKVDFMDADHQGRINFYEKIAVECMKRKLMVYYHGACKPNGLERTFPCIINYEGVMANEYNKWSKDETPKHTVEVAYIRNLAGPMDMNCGSMRNAQGDAFTVSNSMPMTQGTRCHQLAMYISYYAPFSMVGDAPDTYLSDKNCISLISSIPTTWDDSHPVEGKIDEYLVMARKKGEDWFISGLNNEKERDVSIGFDFLDEGKYMATVFSDGINANKVGTDYTIKTIEVTNKSKFNTHMAVGGGFVISLKKIK